MRSMRNGKIKAEKHYKESKHVPDTKNNERLFLCITMMKEPKNGKKVTLTKTN